MGSKLGEELRWRDLQICYPCGTWKAESSNSIGGKDACRSFLWKYLPCLPIAFVKWQPLCLAGLYMVSRRTGAISLLQAVCVLPSDHPLCLSPQSAFIYRKKLLQLVSLNSIVLSCKSKLNQL